MAQRKTATKPKTKTPEPSRSDRIVSIILRFERYAWDAAGIFLIALSLITLVALLIPSLAEGALVN